MNPSSAPQLLIAVPHAEQALAFYARAFGANERTRSTNPQGRTVIHADLAIGRRSLLLDEVASLAAIETEIVTLHLDLPEIAGAWSRAVDAGAVVADPLETDRAGVGCGVLEDPYGHLWSLVATPSDAKLDLIAAQFTPSWAVPSTRR